MFGIARRLKLKIKKADRLFRRMIFNVVAGNHDDRSKNFAFIINQQYQWQLAPA
ncbi:HipA domain-containing protein [Acerihabitans arboris]|uniref:HipA-like C-terminal domain-containing protein n=1 Tax=Acerihabitans arboris TaxID=2691583 RepID=A0A845SGU0_9GAMM|nr:HipA domain-containing protein [Acerihabitans arboris]NDL62164.1 hypothetical protein [Acerihabitans arboris]